MVFFLGFFLTMAGIALLLSPGVRLKRSRLPRRAALWTGGILVSFFPAALLVHFVARKVDPEESVPPDVHFWALAVLVIGGSATLFFRGLKPLTRRPPTGSVPGPTPFDSAPEPETASPGFPGEPQAPPAPQEAQQPPRKAAGKYVPPTQSPFELPGENPFDF